MHIALDDNNSHDQNSVLALAHQMMIDCDCACALDDNDTPVQEMPSTYSLELTPSCNNRCSGCSNVFFDDKQRRIMSSPRREMSFVEWRQILEIIAPYAQRIKVTGGEATLHPAFEQIIKEIEKHEITFTLFTNARWRNPQETIRFLKTIRTCAGLLISLHGSSASSHEAFTGVPGSFNETIRNIALATNAGLSVHVSCVFTKYNIDQLEDVVSLSKKLGANATVFNRYIGKPANYLEISPDQLEVVIRRVDVMRSSLGNVLFGNCIPLCFVDSSSTGCSAGTTYGTIDPWGNMRPCSHTPWLTGNILGSSLEAAWHSETMNQWRKLIPDSCRKCSVFARCRGGCRADALLNSSNEDPLIRRTSGTRLMDVVL